MAATHTPLARAESDAGTADACTPMALSAADPDASAKDQLEHDGGTEDSGARDLATAQAPVLRDFVEAEYPPVALWERREATVVLRLTIDREGRVTEAEVVEGDADGFGEAARAAALRFRFAPAVRGDEPVASRILYRYEFRLPPPPPPSPPSVQTPKPEPQASREPEEKLPEPHPAAAVEVTVQGVSESERLRRSAEAVQIIDTDQAQRQTVDLGEMLARSQGVGVRRGGGLGSGTRFSLAGLTDDQIRFFLDGIPLELSGYPFGVANVPVNVVDRVEIYRGVVPVRFGADALGGAVNLVTDDDVRGTHLAASYQAGSFGTQRSTLAGRHLDEPTGLLARATAFYDYSDNDYPVDVEVPDERGRLAPARAYRFHDDYSAGGGNVEVGFVDRPWAKRLLLRGFVTDHLKEIQHNVVMTVPYGNVEYSELSAGGTLRYEQPLGATASIDAVGGYSYGRTHFVDVGECVVNWFAQCVRARRVAGEIESPPRDQVIWDHAVFARLNLSVRLGELHGLRLSASPNYATRTGDERRQLDPDARDPLTAQRDLTTLVSGLEHELDAAGGRIENRAFVKSYLQIARSEEPLPGDLLRDRDRDTHRLGAGDSLRFSFSDSLYAKASYELATRLPRPDEVFGDGVLIIDNLELLPEVSHNANLGVTLDARNLSTGAWQLDINGFLREADQLIVLLGNDRTFSYQNVFSARSLGFEAAAGWTSPADYLALNANLTYQDFRNTSDAGTFADFDGDRIPNRPYLFTNGEARLLLRGVSAPRDELSLTWHSRYVHQFFRGWESVGLREFKQVVPAQLLHSVALVYSIEGELVTLSFTGEIDNLTDQQAFDFFGVQRPGRAFYFKTTAEL